MRLRRALVALVFAAASTLDASRPAGAAPLDDAEYAALLRGEVVGRPVDAELAGGSYFGVVSYALIDAAPDEVMAVLVDPSAYTSILPLTIAAEVEARTARYRSVRLTQGTPSASASYTVAIERVSPRLVRFWLDQRRPHDIADCVGFVALERAGVGRTLVHWGALVRLDFGITKLLFTEVIRGHARETPALLKRYVERPRPTAPKEVEK